MKKSELLKVFEDAGFENITEELAEDIAIKAAGSVENYIEQYGSLKTPEIKPLKRQSAKFSQPCNFTN